MLALGSAFGGHFGATDATAGYAEARGLPWARPLVLISGVMLLAVAVSIIFGIWPDLGALLYFLFLIAAAFLIHHFWTDEDPGTRQSEMTQFMKDLALSGASLIAFTYFVTVGDDGPFQITGSLFDL